MSTEKKTCKKLPCPLPRHAHLVVMDDALGEGLVQHLLIPLLQALRLGDFDQGVAVEDVVISFTQGTGPDVPYPRTCRTHTTQMEAGVKHPCLPG